MSSSVSCDACHKGLHRQHDRPGFRASELFSVSDHRVPKQIYCDFFWLDTAMHANWKPVPDKH